MTTEQTISKGAPFAVIATGGKQYVVKEGDTLKIEKLSGDWKENDVVTFDQVLLVDDGTDTKIGMPNVAGASVKATLRTSLSVPEPRRSVRRRSRGRRAR